MMQGSDRESRFRQMVERHRDLIMHVCSDYHTGLNKAWEVDDAYQEVLCVLWRDMDTFNGRSAESTWVYRVATTTMLMLRRQSRNQIHEESSQEVDEPAPSTDNYDMLMQLINALGDTDAHIVHAHLDGYSLYEIAQQTGLTTAAVAMRLSRAKRKLKKQYQEVL